MTNKIYLHSIRSPEAPVSNHCYIGSGNNFNISQFSTQRKVAQTSYKSEWARLQQYANNELPYVQAGFRKGRRTRDQIAIIHWIIEKSREFQKYTYFCFVDHTKAFDSVDHNKLWKTYWDWHTRPSCLPSEISVCRSRSNSYNWTWNSRLVPNQERSY